MIPVSFSFFFFIFRFYVMLFILLLLIFTKIISLLFYFIFFMKITVIFSCSGMFRDVPECSGMFRVSGFIDAPIYPLYLLKTKITERNVNKISEASA